MFKANEAARETFKYFWQELAWEYRRIIPALEVACVKVAFTDSPRGLQDSDSPVEQMWINDVQFDGRIIRGTLLNQPNELTSVRQGDQVEVPLSRVNDWLIEINGQVLGAFTVNLMRSRMGLDERQQHDQAWGMEFGDPDIISVAQYDTTKQSEHPMSVNMAESLRDQLNANPGMVNERDDFGWTFLHHQALAGSAATVQVLLEHGADQSVTTPDGQTALQLAESLDWDNVVRLLKNN